MSELKSEQGTAGDDLYGLWHPGSESMFAGFGLQPEPERPELLVGLLLVDRTGPVSSAWLARIEQIFDDYTLIELPAQGERGLACQMEIEAESLPFLRKLQGSEADAIKQVLVLLLTERPKPCLRLHWDAGHRLWLSEFVVERQQTDARSAAPRPLFALGDLLITPGALAAILVAGQTPIEFLVRHVTGNFGDLCAEDLHANVRALQQGGRIFSAYWTANGVRLWVTTEWDRSATTILLPSEY